MKKSPRIAQKLALRKDTVRVLDTLDLSEIAGGQFTTTVTFTNNKTLCQECPSVHVVCDTTINQTV
jgi:hypothetical protein